MRKLCIALLVLIVGYMLGMIFTKIEMNPRSASEISKQDDGQVILTKHIKTKTYHPELSSIAYMKSKGPIWGVDVEAFCFEGYAFIVASRSEGGTNVIQPVDKNLIPIRCPGEIFGE